MAPRLDYRLIINLYSVYTALDRLVAEGLIEPDREEEVDGRLRC